MDYILDVISKFLNDIEGNIGRTFPDIVATDIFKDETQLAKK